MITAKLRDSFMSTMRFQAMRFVLAAACCGISAARARTSDLPAAEPGRADIAVAAAEVRRRDMTNRIDAFLAQRWQEADLQPAEMASDEQYLRRATLDLTGVVPRVSDVRTFLQDERPEKRELLIDGLLSSPRYATHMATTWRNRILPHELDQARSREALALQRWLRSRFARNIRYDNLVGGLLLTTGGADQFGPALYFRAHDLAPEKIAASAAELFLGARLRCAQCHDHPYADWKQSDFWGLAAFFARVKSADDRGMQPVYRLTDARQGEVRLPDTGQIVAPKYPHGDATSDEPGQSRRLQLSLWLTSRDNPFFARAAVNWAWSHLFGASLVEAIDQQDWDEAVPNAPLVDELAEYFVASGFDLQQLWRTLAATRAYQLASQPGEGATDSREMFAHMTPKPLTPEQLYDTFVLLAPRNAGAQRTPGQAVASSAMQEDLARSEFVRRMRTPPGEASEFRASTLQALMLMNGRETDQATDGGTSRLLGALTAPYMSDEQRLDALFLATLSRFPEDDQRQALIELVHTAESLSERERALGDVLWALLNSTEFAFNH
ncbi:MAG: DUF1549 domain-containing protein [Planctomycetota bacterium]